MMKLWLISQNKCSGYDSYDAAVVAAETEDQAKTIHPNGAGVLPLNRYDSGWVHSPECVDCEYLGEAKLGTECGVICASFNAG